MGRGAGKIMDPILTALGLMLVIEGSLYALFPVAMRDMMARVSDLPPPVLRFGGLVLSILGFALIAALKGYE